MRTALTRLTGCLVFVVSGCGTDHREPPPAPAKAEAALARVESLRARFGGAALSNGSVLRHEVLGDGRVRFTTSPRAGLARLARVELPARATGEVTVVDHASDVSIGFAPVAASDARVELTDGGLALYRGAIAGADVVHRIDGEGTEDFVAFDARPAREELAYRVDVRRVAGLRLVSDTLEFLDGTGTPRLRVAPPYVLDAKGARHEAHLAVEGCLYDADPRGPWGRPTIAPGAEHCVVRVTWSDVTYPALVDPAWTTTGAMVVGRWNHTATLLKSGKVLLAAGERSGGAASTAELFDGVGTFAATGSLPGVRCRHTGTLLPSGKVLIAGGGCAGAIADAHLYDEAAGTFAATGGLNAARAMHTATLLPSGKVLIAGGCNTGGSSVTSILSSAELFDGAGTFTLTGPLKVARCAHLAALLPTGKVLLAGHTNSAELFDGTGTFALTGSMSTQRGWGAAAVLTSGKVLVAGGNVNVFSGGVLTTTAEYFDGAGFGAAPSMPVARANFGLVRLATGRVLAVGGGPAEYFDGTAFTAIAPTAAVHTSGRTTLLANGRVLVSGGSDAATSAELLGQQGLSGDSCTLATDCASGVCIDGFCCAGACAGACKTCAPTTGACTAVTLADHSTCNGVNSCDATGACKLKNGQTASAGGSCVSGIVADGVCCNTACGAACDACNNPASLGTCSVAAGFAGAPACAPYACQTGATCPTSCVDDKGCASTAFCAGGACIAKKSSGATCATGARECSNGLCVDGFCCNTACTGNCNACSAALTGVAGSNGTCTLVANGLRGRGECGASSCSSSTTLSTNVCNGAGSCTTKSTSCGAFACTAGACATACAKDADCGGDNYCAGSTCAPKVASGTACTSASVCLSGNCVDGVCCSSSCTGPCEACAETASKGTCVAVSGTPRAPHPACNGAGTSCAGTCDGSNRAVCSYPSAGASCGAGCSGSSLSVCSTSGTCLAATACPGNLACASTTSCKTACAADIDCASTAFCSGSSCAPKLANGSACSTDNQCANAHCISGLCCATSCTGGYACKADGSACRSTCAADSDCATGSYCLGSACTTRKANGEVCAKATECSSGNCVDGVCCDRGCGGACEACVSTKSGVAGSTGTCTFIGDGKDPDGECGTPTCAGTTLNANVCNGGGVCRASVTECGSAKCVVSGTTGTCATTCTVDGDCGSTGFCKAGTCAPKVDRGTACAANTECKGAFCVDGVCCDQACSGQCQACAEPGNVGTCVAAKGKPRAPRADCNGSGGACYGQCDGTNIASCAYPSAGQSCGAGCAAGKTAVCDGTGVCLAPAACPGNFACDGTTKCKVTCVAATDCASGFTCSAGACIPQASATCSPDGAQSIPSGDAGAPQSCAPYRCLSTGACADKCTTTTDCATGHQCDTSTQQCTPAPAPEDGGGCAVGRSRGESGAWLAALALSLIALRRRQPTGRREPR